MRIPLNAIKTKLRDGLTTRVHAKIVATRTSTEYYLDGAKCIECPEEFKAHFYLHELDDPKAMFDATIRRRRARFLAIPDPDKVELEDYWTTHPVIECNYDPGTTLYTVKRSGFAPVSFPNCWLDDICIAGGADVGGLVLESKDTSFKSPMNWAIYEVKYLTTVMQVLNGFAVCTGSMVDVFKTYDEAVAFHDEELVSEFEEALDDD
jgi:hypothetical protein